MKSSKLLRLLSSLSAWELRHFRDFVYSPFHNKHEGIRQLLDILMKSYPEFEAEEVKKEVLYAQLFEGVYRLQPLSDVASGLTKLLEQFLALSAYQSDDFYPTFYLLDELRTRGLEKEYSQHFRQLERRLPQDAYYQHFLMGEAYVDDLAKKKNRATDGRIEEVSRNLDFHYFRTTLRFACERLNRQKVVAVDFDLSWQEQVADQISSRLEAFEADVVLMVYYHSFRLLQGKGEAHFEALMQLLQTRAARIPPNQLPEAYGYLLNHCIRQINQGALAFRQTLFELYQWMVDQRVIYKGKWIAISDCKNIVTVARQLGKYQWAEDFLNAHLISIEPRFREATYAYNLATLRYEEGRFNEALTLLQSADFTDIFYALGAKTLLLKIYYQEGAYEALTSLLDAFTVFLRRNRLLGAVQVARHRNLLKLTRQLLRLKLRSLYSPVEDKVLIVLKEKVEAQKQLAERDWLMREIGRMLKE